jgi:hypothetical protein
VQVSFVNSICTVKGGTHVNYVVDQITKYALPSQPADLSLAEICIRAGYQEAEDS